MKAQCQTIRLAMALCALLVVSALGSGRAAGQFFVTEIIDTTGDGEGNDLVLPWGIAVDAAGTAYVTGQFSSTAFKITSGGVITLIIDADGDGAGNTLNSPRGIAVDAAGNTYVTGTESDNAFKITPGGLISEIISATGDGAGNTLLTPQSITVDAAGKG